MSCVKNMTKMINLSNFFKIKKNDIDILKKKKKPSIKIVIDTDKHTKSQQIEKSFYSFQQSEKTEVIPRVHISNLKTATNINWLNENNITHVLNLSGVSYTNFPNIIYKNINIPDAIDCSTKMYLAEGIPFIYDVIRNPTTCSILVHCELGISRSTFFVAAFLILYLNYTVDGALQQIRCVRPYADPNLGFMLSLYELEKNKKL